MQSQYRREGYRSPTLTTDVIITHSQGMKEGIVLIERKNPPHGLAIPGGFAEYGLTLEQNAGKEAREETGLEVVIENPGQPLVFSDPRRDPRGHMVSTVYWGRGYGELRAGDDAAAARLYTVPEVRALFGRRVLAFDHEEILQRYLALREQS
jgi:ADP-ribose pyrophosphatase YjhB (NUDIX family)